MPSDVSSVFAKKKGKKGKKKSTNLNLDQGIPKPEEKPKIAQLQEILGGVDPSEDDGWADVVEKKSVVATGGKQVSDLIDMTTLMEAEESTASKLEKKDIKQAFHDARTLKEKKIDDTPNTSKEDEKSPEVTAKPKGLSGNIFGGGAAGRGGFGGGWQARMAERELKQREQELSVDNAFAFPTLADAMSGPPKPKPTAVEGNPWARRGGSSAAAAAIKAALGRGGDGESKTGSTAGDVSGEGAAAGTAATLPAPNPKPEEPIWVAPRRGAETTGAEQEATRSAAEGDGTSSARVDLSTKVQPEAPMPNPMSALAPAPTPAPEPVIDAVKVLETAGMQAGSREEGKAPEKDGVEKAKAAADPAPEETPKPSVPPTGTDKEALVQQFGKKKKKKKKPVDGGDT